MVALSAMRSDEFSVLARAAVVLGLESQVTLKPRIRSSGNQEQSRVKSDGIEPYHTRSVRTDAARNRVRFRLTHEQNP